MRSFRLTAVAAGVAASLAVAACGSTPSNTPAFTPIKASSAHESLNGSKATQKWDAKTGDITLTVNASWSLPAGQCADSIFDWAFGDNHHDPRLVRSCVAGKSVTYSFHDTEEGLQGLNKAGICVGPQARTNKPPGQCNVADGSKSDARQKIMTVRTDISPTKPNPCIEAYIIYANGKTQLYDTGNPTSCTE